MAAKWCEYCQKDTHNDAECWSTRSVGWKPVPMGGQHIVLPNGQPALPLPAGERKTPESDAERLPSMEGAAFPDQTRFFDAEKGARGNCLQACLAAVFGLPIDAVPDFTQSHPADWMDDMKAWLSFGGYEWHFDSDDKVPTGALYIVNGQSARGVRHSTVWRDGAMVHDPHPSRAGLLAHDGNVWWFKSRLHAAEAALAEERAETVTCDCGFRYGAEHIIPDEGYKCPVCEESRLQAELATLSETAARLREALDYLERHVFERKWDGTIGRQPSWHMAGPYRHELAKWRGDTLLEAISAALQGAPHAE